MTIILTTPASCSWGLFNQHVTHCNHPTQWYHCGDHKKCNVHKDTYTQTCISQPSSLNFTFSCVCGMPVGTYQQLELLGHLLRGGPLLHLGLQLLDELKVDAVQLRNLVEDDIDVVGCDDTMWCVCHILERLHVLLVGSEVQLKIIMITDLNGLEV